MSTEEAEIHARVAEAKAEYERARAEAKRLLEMAGDLGLQSAGGAVALREATRRQQLATRRYAAALHALADFTVGPEAPRQGNAPGQGRKL